MHSTSFNLYAATAFADHPLALYPLDDDFGFLSLLNGSPEWSTINCTAATGIVNTTTMPTETVGLPDEELVVWTFSGSASYAQASTQAVTASNSNRSVCVSAYVYCHDSIVSSIEIGFDVDGDIDSSVFVPSEEWIRVSHTSQLAGAGTVVTPFIKVTYESYSPEQTFSTHMFLVGQWAELFAAISEGVVGVPFSTLSASATLASAIGGALSASPSLFKVVEVDSYGVTDDHGYYFIENNNMLATNQTLPMVYGSSNVTELVASAYGIPSIVFPANGFLHEQGRSTSMTAEFWLRVYEETTSATKFFGPLEGTDGLYLDKGYLVLRVGPYEKGYMLNQLYRPMLVSVSYSPDAVSVFINGDIVITLVIDQNEIEFKDKNWLGVWTTGEIPILHIDCLAIYPYAMSSNLAKKKFVYGQGVGPLNNTISKFGGTASEMNFSFANYSFNTVYPDLMRWDSGYFSNMDASSTYLSFPQYELPQINFYGEDLSLFSLKRLRRTWGTIAQSPWSRWASMPWRNVATVREGNVLYDNYPRQINYTGVNYIKLKPHSGYSNVYGSIDFNTISQVAEGTSSIHAVFSINAQEQLEIPVDGAVLMKIKSRNSSDAFTVTISQAGLIEYYFNNILLKSFGVAAPEDQDNVFVVGIRLQDLIEAHYNTLRNFFANPRSLIMSVGGSETRTFPGKIYRVTFNNRKFDTQDNDSLFDSDGMARYSALFGSATDVLEYIGNYTVLFKKSGGTLVMDIGCVGYWEDSIPMSMMGAQTQDGYELDLIQFNIDYPSSLYLSESLPNPDVKVYATVQGYQDIGGIPYSTYTNIKALDGTRVVDLDSVGASADFTKFEVVDGVAIIPPRTLVDFDSAYLTIHIEAKSHGINTRPFYIPRLSVASLANNRQQVFKVGASTGNGAYPFTRSGTYYTTKATNPFLMDKHSTPYLYNSANSGIVSVPYTPAGPEVTRGISVPINVQRRNGYEFYGFQAFVMLRESSSVPQTVEGNNDLFCIRAGGEEILISVVQDSSGERGVISIECSDDDRIVHVYQDGIKIPNAVLTPGRWTMLNFTLHDAMTIDGSIGQIEIYPGVAVDNLAVYEVDNEGRIDDIVESILGLSSLIISDDSIINVTTERLDVYNDMQWTKISGKPI